MRTHGRLLAPISEGGSFPVVFLEHGSGVVPAIYTVLAEGLASSGFIVVATNHPPDSLIAAFPDGHERKFTPYWPAEADRRTQGVAILPLLYVIDHDYVAVHAATGQNQSLTVVRNRKIKDQSAGEIRNLSRRLTAILPSNLPRGRLI